MNNIIDISSDDEGRRAPKRKKLPWKKGSMNYKDYNHLFMEFKEQSLYPSQGWLDDMGLPSWRGRVIVIDTETTGLNVNSERIVELAAIELVDGVRSCVQFHGYVNAIKESSPQALKVHGLSKEILKHKPDIKHVLERFMAFLGTNNNYSIIAHNKSFDMSILNNELVRSKLPRLSLANTYCSIDAFQSFGTQRCSLQTLAHDLKIRLREHSSNHSALEDCRATSELVQFLWMKFK